MKGWVGKCVRLEVLVEESGDEIVPDLEEFLYFISKIK